MANAPYNLYSNFVPALSSSSSGGGGNVSDDMTNDDDMLDSAEDEHAIHRREQPSYNAETQQQSNIVTTYVDRQHHQMQAHETDDIALLMHASPAVKQGIADAYKQAAQEQYRVGDLLLQKAARLSSVAITELPSHCNKQEPVVHSDNAGDRGIKSLRHSAAQTLVEEPETPAHSLEAWFPVVIRELNPTSFKLAKEDNETFTWETIVQTLGGRQWSPGFYWVSNPNHEIGISGCTAYWVLEGTYEPFAPSKPGMHGAKLTAFFRPFQGDEDEPLDTDYHNTPVFVSQTIDGEFQYMGHYTQCRYSDRLDHDSQQHVPDAVFRYWAEEMSRKDRPLWLAQSLIQHFWPRPTYEGPIPTESAVPTPASSATGIESSFNGVIERRVRTALDEYVVELKDWRRDAHLRLAKLTPEVLFEAFKKSDSERTPGLRLNWEYLQCLRWDKDFYNGMLNFKHGINPHARERKKSKGKAKAVEQAQEYILSHAPHRRDPGGKTSSSSVKQEAAPETQTAMHGSTTSSSPRKTSLPPHLRARTVTRDHNPKSTASTK